MINFILLLGLATPLAGAAAPPTATFLQEEDAEVQKKIADCGDDVDKLIALAEEFRGASNRKAARAAFARVLELDENSEKAHKGLGHHLYDGKWFETYSALSAHKRAEAKRMLEEHGKVRFKDEWVLEADLPFLRMGWAKDDSGVFRSKADTERLALEKQRLADGWKQQTDLVWVHPDEAVNWEEGLLKVGEEWMSVEEANAFHSEIKQPWTVPGERFLAITTLEWEKGVWAAWWADQTYADLQRLYGVHPPEKPRVIVLNSNAQYNLFAAGDNAKGVRAAESTGESSIHYAFYANELMDNTVEPAAYQGTGVGYWEPGSERLANFGQHSIRWAAGQAYAEAVDPSWNAISRMVSTKDGNFRADEFWREKKIPRWMRYGAASYVERYFVDNNVGEEGDPMWARNWALGNLKQRGGLRPLPEIFKLEIDTNNPTSSERLLSESGCVVAFVLDGGVDDVVRAHQAFKTALRNREDTKATVEALEKAIIAHEAELKTFAGLE